MKWTGSRITAIILCVLFVAPIIFVPVLLIYWNVVDRMDRDSPVLAARSAATPPKPPSRLETWIAEHEAENARFRRELFAFLLKHWFVWLAFLVGYIIFNIFK
jgi:hypothetical protein